MSDTSIQETQHSDATSDNSPPTAQPVETNGAPRRWYLPNAARALDDWQAGRRFDAARVFLTLGLIWVPFAAAMASGMTALILLFKPPIADRVGPVLVLFLIYLTTLPLRERPLAQGILVLSLAALTGLYEWLILLLLTQEPLSFIQEGYTILEVVIGAAFILIVLININWRRRPRTAAEPESEAESESESESES